MFSLIIQPTTRVKLADTTVELWVAERKLPVMAASDAMVVPVAPDLNMGFGVAKRVRDYGGNTAQYEANRVAPLLPGQAFIGTGARYRFKHTTLAVIFDDCKRTSADLITQGIQSALRQAAGKSAESVLFADMTENLLAQPTWIKPEQRRATAELTARLMLEAILASEVHVPLVRIWVWTPANAPIFEQELKRLEKMGLAAYVANAARPPAVPLPNTKQWLDYGQSAQIKDSVLTVAYGDPLTATADAILRPTDTHLEAAPPGTPIEEDTPTSHAETGAPTLADRILADAGPEIAAATLALGVTPLGSAGLTSAGDLTGFRHIIHLACREPDAPATAQALRDSVESALTLADINRIRTLVIPNIGAGRNDYSSLMATQVAVDACADYLQTLGRHSGIERIFLVGETTIEQEQYANALARFFPLPIPLPAALHDDE